MLATVYDETVHGKRVFTVGAFDGRGPSHTVTDNVWMECEDPRRAIIFKKVPGRPVWAALYVSSRSQNWKDFRVIWFLNACERVNSCLFGPSTRRPYKAFFGFAHLEGSFPSEEEADWIALNNGSFTHARSGGWLPQLSHAPTDGDRPSKRVREDAPGED
jgi:hypothetical protein